MKRDQFVIVAVVIVGLMLLWQPEVGPPAIAEAEPVESDAGFAAAVLGMGAGSTPIVVPTPGPAPEPGPAKHSRSQCPTQGWVTQGDGHRTRCLDCDPPYTAADEAPVLIDLTPAEPEPAPVLLPIVMPSLSEQLGVSDPSLAYPAWTWPGDIQRHLEGTHGVDRAMSLSDAEAIRLHNQLHNAERRGVPIGAVAYQSGDCPDGMCPTDAFGNVSGDCPSGTCPSSSGVSRSSAVGVGSVLAPLKGLRERRPVRALAGRLFCRGGRCR